MGLTRHYLSKYFQDIQFNTYIFYIEDGKVKKNLQTITVSVTGGRNEERDASLKEISGNALSDLIILSKGQAD